MSEAMALDGTVIMALDSLDRRLVAATQAGLPLCPRPYRALAERLGVAEAEVMDRLRRMQATGVIRRIGAVPNHYALGYRANGMSVWDVRDDKVATLGPRVGALDFVSHCYHRPRHLPDWPYNLFAMVHGRTRDEVSRQVDEIAALLGAAARGHDILYSTRILKKTGLRLTGSGRQSCSD
jgi:DNA-binding Lrp family transcriptional regulator